MIITLHGTIKGNNCCAGAASILAAITALKHKRTTLILQLYNNTKYSVEAKLHGRFLKNTQFTENIQNVDFKGIDYLLTQLSTTNLRKEDFIECATTVLKKENLLDILKVTEKQTLEEELTNDLSMLQRLLDNAREHYDYVYVCLPNNGKEIIETACQAADINIICVPQGEREAYVDCKNKIFLATDYCKNTRTYDEKYIKRAYEARRLFLMEHNTDYKDADISGTLLEFVMRNIKDDRSDTNFSFISKFIHLVSYLCKKSEAGSNDGADDIDDEEETSLDFNEISDLESNHQEAASDLTPLDEVDIVTTEIKQGFFKRKSVKTVATSPDMLDCSASDEEVSIESLVNSKNTITDKAEEILEAEKKTTKNTKRILPKFKKKQKEGKEPSESDDTFIPITPEALDQPIRLKQPLSTNEDSFSAWICNCGTQNEGNFCKECGCKKPSKTWVCNCGTKNEGNFCKECGCAKPIDTWYCSCGTQNDGKFCIDCGLAHISMPRNM